MMDGGNGGNGDTPEIGGDDSPGGYHEYAPISEPTETEIYVPNDPVYNPETDAPGTPIPDDNGNDHNSGGDSGGGWDIGGDFGGSDGWDIGGD